MAGKTLKIPPFWLEIREIMGNIKKFVFNELKYRAGIKIDFIDLVVNCLY